MALIRKRAASSPSLSMFTFPTFAWPTLAVAISSTMGEIIRQGPHQGAQKSTRTGTSDLITSWSKLAAVSSITFALAMMRAESAELEIGGGIDREHREEGDDGKDERGEAHR